MNGYALKRMREKNARKLFQVASGKSIAETIGKGGDFVSKIKLGSSPLPRKYIELLHARYGIYGITIEYLETLTKDEKDRL